MPLATGVVPSSVVPRTLANLEHQIKEVDGGHLDTGLTGTYFMTKMLMEAGRNDLIFTWANKTDYPSYGYFLELGYTTWPEQWNVKSGSSLMHGCYNAIGVWFVEVRVNPSYHTLHAPFIHRYSRTYTYLHPLYMYILPRKYTIYTPKTPLNTLYTPYIHPIYALNTP